MNGYIFNYQGKTFEDSGGQVEDTDADSHNKRLDKENLDTWADAPPVWPAYVHEEGDKETGDLYHECLFTHRLHSVTTWLGADMGKIISASAYINNFGVRIACIRVKATNGCEYFGRFGYDKGDLVILRKVK